MKKNEVVGEVFLTIKESGDFNLCYHHVSEDYVSNLMHNIVDYIKEFYWNNFSKREKETLYYQGKNLCTVMEENKTLQVIFHDIIQEEEKERHDKEIKKKGRIVTYEN